MNNSCSTRSQRQTKGLHFLVLVSVFCSGRGAQSKGIHYISPSCPGDQVSNWMGYCNIDQLHSQQKALTSLQWKRGLGCSVTHSTEQLALLGTGWTLPCSTSWPCTSISGLSATSCCTPVKWKRWWESLSHFLVLQVPLPLGSLGNSLVCC